LTAAIAAAAHATRRPNITLPAQKAAGTHNTPMIVDSAWVANSVVPNQLIQTCSSM